MTTTTGAPPAPTTGPQYDLSALGSLIAGKMPGWQGRLGRTLGGGALSPRFAGLGVLAALTGAASQFADSNDTVTGNAVDATGSLAGSLAGGALGAIVGSPLGPVGSLTLGSLGASMGGEAGKGLTRGLTDAFFQVDPRERELRYKDKAEQLDTKNKVERARALMPFEMDAQAARTADAIARARVSAALASDANYQNALLTQLVNSSAQNTAGLNALASQLLNV
jgi:phage tail tape-measure protein